MPGERIESMKIRILTVIVAGVLTGCTSQSIVKNLYLPNCSGQVSIPQAKAAPCMTNAEYYTARKKAKHSQDKSTGTSGKEVDPQYKDLVP
jgi:hypothetical protein